MEIQFLCQWKNLYFRGNLLVNFIFSTKYMVENEKLFVKPAFCEQLLLYTPHWYTIIQSVTTCQSSVFQTVKGRETASGKCSAVPQKLFEKLILEENKERLELVFLPPYNPNLNKIEELWGWLKDSVINNVFFHSREEIQKAVRKFIDWISTVPQMVIDRLCL